MRFVLFARSGGEAIHMHQRDTTRVTCGNHVYCAKMTDCGCCAPNPTFETFEMQHVCKRSLNNVRLSCHSLPIETGRHHRPPIPRSSRLCPHCPLASVGDEYHIVFECPFFQPLRDKYHTLFSSQTSSMRSLFAQKERMTVYKFVLDCLDMINA